MAKQIIRADLLLDMTGKPPMEGGAVLIENDKISAVGKAADFTVDADTEVIDCAGQVLMPGLIDCHNHLSLDTRLKDHLLRMDDPLPELTLRAVETMKTDLLSGVTTSRCCGDKGFLDITCKKAVEAGRFQGPRLLAATRGIRASHGHGFVGYPIDGLEPIRTAVRENLAAGADLIKIYITGTLRGDGRIPSFFTKSEINLAVQEARRNGVRSATHCIGGQGMDWALEIGIDSIEHAFFITDAQIERCLDSDCWLVMTPSPFFDEDRIQTLHSADLMDQFRKERDLAAERMGAAIKAGVKFAVGTDGRHGGLARDAETVVAMGASETQALMAATRNGARVCGIEDRVGTLAPGMLADIIGVRGNPLKDIGALKNVETVVQGGRLVKGGKDEG
jgi:imidazolonepropionase-like amidohydrolase